MVATSAFYRLTCSLAAGAGGEACMEAPVQGDLPRFQIQPPSCHSAAAGTGGGGGAAIGSDLAVLPEGSQSTAAGSGSDSPRRASYLAVTEHFSVSSVGCVAHNSDDQLTPAENTEL